MNKLLGAIFKICKEHNAITKVDDEYYQMFLDMTDKQMEALIKIIVCDQVKTINKKILSGEWQDDQDIYEFIMQNLKMIARGMMGIREKDVRLCLYKPVGNLPSKNIQKKIDAKIKNTTPLIDKIILQLLKNQKTASNN